MEQKGRVELTTPSQSASDSRTGVSPGPTDRDLWARLSRELHDGVTQQVWYLQAELSRLSDRLGDDQPELRAEVDRLKAVAQSAYQELRTTLNLLHSRATSCMNLAAELSDVATKFSAALEMKVEFHADPEAQKVEVSGEMGRQIRRLVQEALWNSWRHSASATTRVALQLSRIGLVVTVADDGCGFHPDKVDEGHFGLQNMRQRAETIKGRLYVTSGPGQGTQVTLHIPTQQLYG